MYIHLLGFYHKQLQKQRWVDEQSHAGYGSIQWDEWWDSSIFGYQGSTLQVIHNIVNHKDAKYCSVPFAYFNNFGVEAVKVVLFQKSLLAITEPVTVPTTMKILLQMFTGSKNADLVGPLMDKLASKRTMISRNFMYLPFALILLVMGQNLTPKTAACVLVPVMSSLGLVCPQLINFLLAVCTKTSTNNNSPVMVQDTNKMGLEHGMWLFWVFNHHHTIILYNQLPTLHPGGTNIGAAISMQNGAFNGSNLFFDCVTYAAYTRWLLSLWH